MVLHSIQTETTFKINRDKLMNSTQKNIDEILDAHLALVGTNIEAWSDLLSEYAIMELPYGASLGMPARLEGKSAIYNYLKEGIAEMQNLTVTNVRKYPMVDPNLLWTEYRSEAIIPATGRHFQEDYVTRLQIADGKIVYLGNYFNPTAVIDAFGNNRPQRTFDRLLSNSPVGNSQAETQSTPHPDIVDAYLASISTNIEAWSDLLVEDAIMEVPYAAALGVPPRLEGKSVICNYLKPVTALMPNLVFTNVRKYLTLNPNMWWVEVHGEAVIPCTGHHYQQDYALLMETMDGKIVHVREYSNPIPSMDAFGINNPILSDQNLS
jgi:uncharacterized protein